MAAEDWIPGDPWGEGEDGEDDGRPVCHRCGTKCDGWRQHPSGKWWMVEGFRWHRCPAPEPNRGYDPEDAE